MGLLLKDKVIFLTGGAAGIGYECAKVYIQEGAILVVFDKIVAKIDGLSMSFVGDVSNAAEVQESIRNTINQFGRIDAVHNNAGIAHPSKPIHETTEEEWNNLINTNLKSVFLTTKFAFETLKQNKGTILTKSMALDYASFGIRVNAVAPAGVWTPMLRTWALDQPNPTTISEYLDQIHPLGFCPEGDVIADVCAFLLSEKARFITGCILPVSGGAELGYRR